MQFASYFHDPDNLFVPLLKDLVIPEEIRGSYVSVSPETTATSYNLISELGFKIVKGGPYGFGKLAALKASLANSSFEQIMICDFDKLLHWLATDKKEFLEILKSSPFGDFINIGRGDNAMKTYPRSWLDTEAIASKLMEKIIGIDIDIMNGPVVLSREAATFISEYAQETEVGACAEWCLICYQKNLKIVNLEVNGLTWEDPDRYPNAIAQLKDFDIWKEKTFDSLYEWRKRVEFLHMQVKAMIRLMHEPTNPKFPYVHNQTFKN